MSQPDQLHGQLFQIHPPSWQQDLRTKSLDISEMVRHERALLPYATLSALSALVGFRCFPASWPSSRISRKRRIAVARSWRPGYQGGSWCTPYNAWNNYRFSRRRMPNVCMRIPVHIYMYTHIRVCTHTRIPTHLYIYIYVCTYIYIYIYYMCIHRYIYVCVVTCKSTYMYTHIYSYLSLCTS